MPQISGIFLIVHKKELPYTVSCWGVLQLGGLVQVLWQKVILRLRPVSLFFSLKVSLKLKYVTLVWCSCCCVFRPANRCSTRHSMVKINFLMLKQLFVYFLVNKSCFSVRKSISTSKRCAEHPFAGRNTQHAAYTLYWKHPLPLFPTSTACIMTSLKCCLAGHWS